ncbi:FadR/GntR family transcriptional regulator [Cellulomonas cellasea]|uniref:FadR/GntR family transcriptional regulator n=1 Tax=Cellulomonas cellasea TaxID=43670 RepID=UPI0025A4A00B|nr:FadR/GntR family transcriptional regulator [Cellulomonas cellasea]MDM8084604.1 FadR/GntR family transcriptional regulator [Cellulomonas cellasea]
MPTPVPPLARRSPTISVTLAAHLERLIATGQLAPGQRLPGERELAAQLAVSRASLREAMFELESKHLIERRPGRGTVVVETSAEQRDLHDLTAGAGGPGGAAIADAAELRLIVEPSVAGLAARRATPANLLQLHDVLDASVGPLTPSRSVELDLEFHLLLAQAARNPLLTTLHGLMGEWTLPIRRRSHTTKAGRARSLAGHRDIYAAVDAHDPDAATAAMHAHLLDIHTLLEDS